MLQSVRVSPATSHHLRIPPYIFIYMLSTFFFLFLLCATVIYTGELSFQLPSSIVFTSEYPLNLLYPHPFPVLSIFPALCVLLRSSNFPFDFGGNAFFTNQRGSQPAPPPHTLPSLFPSSLLPSSLFSSLCPPFSVSRSGPPWPSRPERR